jgi:25S rRNA (uracil2634-N3)-methyltransferase
MATCYDDEDTLHKKYPQARQIILQLLSTHLANLESSVREEDESEWKGLSPSPPVLDAAFPATLSQPTETITPRSHSSIPSNAHTSVHYGVDATRLSSTHSKLFRLNSPFTKIVFNFPHVGGRSTDVNRQVRANQQLLVGFFKAAIPLLASVERPVRVEWGHGRDGDYDDSDEVDEESSFSGHDFESKEKTIVSKGQILVTLFEGEPYTLWNIRDLARHSGLKVVESFRFPWDAYPGYAHSRTLGDITKGKDRTAEGKRKGAWRGEEREARCFVLEVKDEGGNVGGNSVGTGGNNVDLRTRRKRKRMADSDSGSD